MKSTALVSVIIPALNEEAPIPDDVRACLTTGLPNEVIMVDNSSTDRGGAAWLRPGLRGPASQPSIQSAKSSFSSMATEAIAGS
jgi:hypothetical protein